MPVWATMTPVSICGAATARATAGWLNRARESREISVSLATRPSQDCCDPAISLPRAMHARNAHIESALRFAGAVRLFAKRANRLRVEALNAHDRAPVAAGDYRVAIGTYQSIVRRQADHRAGGLQAEARPDQLQSIGLRRTGPDHHVAELVRVPAVQRGEVEPRHVALHVLAVVDCLVRVARGRFARGLLGTRGQHGRNHQYGNPLEATHGGSPVEAGIPSSSRRWARATRLEAQPRTHGACGVATDHRCNNAVSLSSCAR